MSKSKKTVHVSQGAAGASRDVQREIDLHLELRAREFEAQGMTPDAARRAALEAFGNRALIEDEVRGLRTTVVRERARRDWRSELRQDLVVALRGLRRAPAFTTIALLTLALGIGANAAIFSVLRPVLLRPLPYPDADRLVQVWSDHRALGRQEPEWLTPPDFEEWRDQNTTFSAMAAYQGWGPDLTGSGDPRSLAGVAVSGNFLSMLGALPAAGRLLTPADDNAGAEPVIVLSHALWQRQFGADPGVIGRPLLLNGEPWRVVGVTDSAFRPPVASPPDLFRTIRRLPTDGCGRGCVVLRAIGRLKPGVSLSQAQGDLARIAERQARDFPKTNAKVGAWLVPLHEQVTGQTKPALLALAGAVGFVLLIACVNLASLLLVRGAGRARELGVRAALGAGRGRILRQLLVESAVLAVLGGALGLVVAYAGSGALSALVPENVRSLQHIGVDGAVIAFTAAITLLAGAIFGLLPALHAARTNLMDALRSGAREIGARGGRMRASLVVSELALAVVLLVGAGLLMRSFLLMQRVDLGFRTDNVLVSPVFFPRSRYPTLPRAAQAIDELLARLRANPAIRNAEVSDVTPLGGAGDQDVTAIAIGESPRASGPDAIWYRAVSGGYLQAMEMRLVSGRYFTADDRVGSAPVAIVNEEAARAFWGGKSPVGRVLATSDDPSEPRVTIVGVVQSARHDGPNQPYKTEMFLPIGQFPTRAVNVVLVPATGNDAAIDVLRGALREVDPLVPLNSATPIAQLAGDAVALPRLYATLVGLFAGVAILLAMLGVYGVMAYTVTQRRREIGVRLAMGASPAGIRRLVLGEGGRLAILGAVGGLLLSLLAGRLLSTMLFGVRPYDLPTLAGVIVVLGGMALLASWLPARRAMRVDPLEAMRET
ncbi:MAG: ABC transporter permease [Gemmatimonadota bacterium]